MPAERRRWPWPLQEAVRARKQHVCDLCERSIPVGVYYSSEGITPWNGGDGSWGRWRLHLECWRHYNVSGNYDEEGPLDAFEFRGELAWNWREHIRAILPGLELSDGHPYDACEHAKRRRQEWKDQQGAAREAARAGDAP